MPTTYGMVTHERHPDPGVLLLERMCDAPVEVPARTPERREQFKGRTVEVLLVWHRQGSRGCVDVVDNTQENFWLSRHRRHVEVLWTTLSQFNSTGLAIQDKWILFRARECLPALLEGFNDNYALIHDNFRLRSMLKNSRSDQLLAVVGPRLILWVSRGYELLRLMDNSLVEDLSWSYLQRVLVTESLIW